MPMARAARVCAATDHALPLIAAPPRDMRLSVPCHSAEAAADADALAGPIAAVA